MAPTEPVTKYSSLSRSHTSATRSIRASTGGTGDSPAHLVLDLRVGPIGVLLTNPRLHHADHELVHPQAQPHPLFGRHPAVCLRCHVIDDFDPTELVVDRHTGLYQANLIPLRRC